MPYSLTFVCSLPLSTVIVSPSEIETTLPERAKRGEAITRIAKDLINDTQYSSGFYFLRDAVLYEFYFYFYSSPLVGLIR